MSGFRVNESARLASEPIASSDTVVSLRALLRVLAVGVAVGGLAAVGADPTGAQAAPGASASAAPSTGAARTAVGAPSSASSVASVGSAAGPPGTSPAPAPVLAGSLEEVVAADTAPVKPPAGVLIGLPVTASLRRGVTAPRPTPAQRKALAILEGESKRFERGAKDFRNTLSNIVKHHFELKRKRMLSAIEKEIEGEDAELKVARENAIARLKEFIARYDGDRADRKATPDAMFRLAALYEERAKADTELDLAEALLPTIDLYRQLIVKFPDYERIAAVHYYLGHAYQDAGRIHEAQQVWRSLVCSDRYKVLDAPGEPHGVVLEPLAQDHDGKFWNSWYIQHPEPLDKVGIGALGVGRQGRAPARKVETADENSELTYTDPFPADCKPLSQPLEPGEDPKYLAEVWWQIGNYHFDELDAAQKLRGGPYSLNRAYRAYEQALEFKKPPLYGVALYKASWTLYKQQRYHAAVDAFVKLLRYTDEQEKRTGDKGADFRTEAYTYIAGSLTYVDFDGPPGAHPNIPRMDVFDTERDPAKAEKAMAIAIERVQDGKLIPQEEPWTADIYKALAQEFAEINQYNSVIRVLELTLSRWPNDRDAPTLQNRISETYTKLADAATSPELREELSQKSLEARSRLTAYVSTPETPTTPWLTANKNDIEAIRQAERLVKVGLKDAAVALTNYASSLFNRAADASDPVEQRKLVGRSVAEYRKAERAWAAYIAQDPTALDGYESRYWLADARYEIVHLQVELGQTPTAEELRRALKSAKEVRDSNEDDSKIQQSAYFVVGLYELMLRDQYRQHKESNGARGIPERTENRFVGTDKARKVAADPLPGLIRAIVHSRDEYNYTLPMDRDPKRAGLDYAFQSATFHFVYGDFPVAKERFGAIHSKYCGVNKFGFDAWKRLVDMAVLSGDYDESRKLVSGKPCYFDEESKRRWESLKNPISQELAFEDARRLFEEAKRMKDGPERDDKWRKAAAAYRVALEQGPDRPEAPEAAINGAYAFLQVAEFDSAVDMYQLFIAKYGDDGALVKLRDGDKGAKPPKAADRPEYEKRVTYLKQAYDALADAHMKFFSFPKAAETFAKVSSIEHFKVEDRRAAAKASISLFASLGDVAQMDKARVRFAALGATPEDVAETDYMVARAELAAWDENAPDTGANQAARQRAQRSLEAYWEKYKTNAAAARWLVQVAYAVANIRRTTKSPQVETWQTRVVEAFEAYRAKAPMDKDSKGQPISAALKTQEAALAAESEYAPLDAELKKKFDYEAGFHRFKGDVASIRKAFDKDFAEAQKTYDTKLEALHKKYATNQSLATMRIGAIISARQGSLYDSVRTGLYNSRPPELKLFTAAEEQALKIAENSTDENQRLEADIFRTNRQTKWRVRREALLDSSDRLMVRMYVEAVARARASNASAPEVTHALRRLAFFTELLGDAKMQMYAAPVKSFKYTPEMFLRQRPGVIESPKTDGTAGPQPVSAE